MKILCTQILFVKLTPCLFENWCNLNYLGLSRHYNVLGRKSHRYLKEGNCSLGQLDICFEEKKPMCLPWPSNVWIMLFNLTEFHQCVGHIIISSHSVRPECHN